MSIAFLVASFLTPAVLIAGWAIWRKSHIYYIEKKSSFFLSYTQRLIAELAVIKGNSKLSYLTNSKEADMEQLMQVMNSASRWDAKVIAKMLKKEDEKGQNKNRRSSLLSAYRNGNMSLLTFVRSWL